MTSNEPILHVSGSNGGMSDEDHLALCDAVYRLECVSFMMKLANLAGTSIEAAISHLPPRVRKLIEEAARKAIHLCMGVAILGMDSRSTADPWNKTHKAMCALSGAVGGFFGVTALTLELPVSTAIMLRSVADIARHEGEDLSDQDTMLSCIGVLHLEAETEVTINLNSATMGYGLD